MRLNLWAEGGPAISLMHPTAKAIVHSWHVPFTEPMPLPPYPLERYQCFHCKRWFRPGLNLTECDGPAWDDFPPPQTVEENRSICVGGIDE